MTDQVQLAVNSRAHHIGSLLRPQTLKDARERYDLGQLTAGKLKAVEDAAIVEVVGLQKQLGLKTITDGEYRRTFFYEGMFEKLEGMTIIPNRPLSTCKPYLPYIQVQQSMGMTEAPSVYCTGKIRRTEGIYTEDFEYLKSLVNPEEVRLLKLTMVSPIWLHIRHGSNETYDPSVYNSDDEYFSDLIRAYREEIEALYNLGCRQIQIDDPSFCFICVPSMRAGMRDLGEDPEVMMMQYINVYNAIFEDIPDDLIVGVHMCRGNFRGMHYCEGGYEPIAATLFKELSVDRFYLEYDNDRAGGLEPLRYLPLDKVVVLGLVTTKTGSLETLQDIKDRVEQAVSVIAAGEPTRSRQTALSQICISPQCGFASTADGNPITEEDQRNKLALIVEAAQEIWGGRVQE